MEKNLLLLLLMDCFIGKFITEFSAKLGKKINFKNSKDANNYIINMLKKNQNSNILIEHIDENKFNLITNILFETNYDNIELQKIKQNIIINLLTGKKIDVDKEEKRIIFAVKENVLTLRKKIIQIIKDETKDLTIIDPLNEIKFFQLISKEKEFIQQFITKYKIKRIKFDNKIFEHILSEFKSFDLNTLKNIFNYLNNFNIYYSIYNVFISLIKNIIKNDNIINFNYFYILMDNNVHFLSLGFKELSKNIEIANDEVKNLKKNMRDMRDEIGKMKDEMQKMKFNYENKIQNLEKKYEKKYGKKIYNNQIEIQKLKNKLERISNNLKCPISHEIINDPVITPYGITYEKSKIIRWLIHSDIDPVNKLPFSVDQLVTNFALKNIIEEFNKK